MGIDAGTDEKSRNTRQDTRGSETALLKEIAQNTRAQKRNGVILVLVVSICSILITAGILWTCRDIMIKVDEAVADLQETTDKVDRLASDAQTAVTTAQTMMEENSEAVAQTMEKVSKIDFDTLNRSIKNLSDVIQPLSRFFGTLGGGSGTR